MAIKPTIYKARIALSDLERNYYDALSLTIAQHPSETLERMMVRLLVFCIHAEEDLSFTKGLCEVEEPDIWLRTMDEQISLWLDVGEPSAERVKKATHQARKVVVYSFNTKSDVWWEQGEPKFSRLEASFNRFSPDSITALVELVERTMDLSITISGDTAYITNSEGSEVEVSWVKLQEK